MGVMLAGAGLQLLLLAVYFVVEAYTGMVSAFLILVVFLVQQAFVFSRIQVRQLLYAGIGKAAAA